MKFLADENFPLPSVLVLRTAGHDVVHVGEVASGSSDEVVIAMAQDQERAVLTFDGDMGTLAMVHHKFPIGGIVYFRLYNYLPEDPGVMLLDYLNANPGTELGDSITVFDPPRVRQRRLGEW